MHATADFVDEWAFVVDAQDFRSWLKGLELSSDIERHSFDAATGVVGAGGYGSSQKRGRAMTRERFCHHGHGLLGAFHYIVAPGAMDVDVDESGNGGLAACGDFRYSGRQADVLTGADGFNHAVSNQDSGIGDFCRRS